MKKTRITRKSTWLCTILFLYVTVTMIWLAPENSQVSTREKMMSVGVAYAAIILLWFLLRRKEKMAERRKTDNPDKPE